MCCYPISTLFIWLSFGLMTCSTMACDFQALYFRTIKTSSHSTLISPSIFLKHQQLSYLSTYPWNHISHRSPLLISSCLSPPRSKEEAILQARTSLYTALDNNAKLAAGRFKKVKQPKFRIEIPVVDDESPDCLSQLTLQIFGDSAINILILWPNLTLKEAGIKSFGSHSSIEHMDILTANNRNVGSNDIAVFVAPETTQLSVIKAVSDNFYPRPVAIFNPRWGFDEEANLGQLRGFVASFKVVYSFTGLEVRGLLSRRKGVIFKTEGSWSVWVEEQDGDFKLVSRFKARPSLVQVENVLYNVMAINSPLTKSVKFLRDVLSNVTAKK